MIIRTVEATKRGIAEVLRRRLAEQRKGPTTRGPIRPPPPPELPKGPLERFPRPIPQPSSPPEPLPELQIPTGPIVAPRGFPQPRIKPSVQPGPIQVPQPPPVPQVNPFALPELLPLALPFALPRPQANPALRLTPGSPSPGLNLGPGTLTAVQPAAQPRLQRCRVVCRKTGGKKKKKKTGKVCLTPRELAELGVTKKDVLQLPSRAIKRKAKSYAKKTVKRIGLQVVRGLTGF